MAARRARQGGPGPAPAERSPGGPADGTGDRSGAAGATARARVRAELRAEILAVARQELATSGAAGLSLRAVARRLQMVPSGLYRYFAGRDALLTAMIVDAYGAIGAAAAAADAGAVGAAGGDPAPLDRWLAVTDAVRRWAQGHPQEWALVYGSPVPGYRAPRETVEPALGITRVIAGIVADAVPAGGSVPASLPPGPGALAAAVAPLEAALLPGRPAEAVVGAMLAWTEVVGTVSFELSGHFVGATEDFDLVFGYAMRAVAAVVGIG